MEWTPFEPLCPVTDSLVGAVCRLLCPLLEVFRIMEMEEVDIMMEMQEVVVVLMEV